MVFSLNLASVDVLDDEVPEINVPGNRESCFQLESSAKIELGMKIMWRFLFPLTSS